MDASKIDPRLSLALDDADLAGNPVRAVVTVGTRGRSSPMQPGEAERMIQSLVDRASRESNSSPNKLVLFPHMQSFSIEAEPVLLRKILNEESVDAATLNSSTR